MLQTNAQYFFETGTWRGDGLAYAARYPFKELYSSEIIESVASKAKERFVSDKRVHIINDSSVNALEKTLDQVKGNCIFWLDAHFPGAEEGLKSYNEYEDENVKLPLEKELQLIASRKFQYNDVILIDDLRIYEEGNYESGNLPKNVLPPKVRNTNFAQNLFSDTHDIHKSLNDEGYLILIPKNVKEVAGIKGVYFQLLDKLKKKIV